MAGSPKKSPLYLLLFFVAIAALSLSATLIHKRYGSPDKVVDTAIRTKLLKGKSYQASFDGYNGTNSNIYSAFVYDHKVDTPSLFRLPWAKLVERSPNGDYSFSWRIKLSFKALFAFVIDENAPGDFSLKLSARDGSQRVVQTDSILIPSVEVILEPGIYILKAKSTGPLDFFNVGFENAGEGPLPVVTVTSVGGGAIEPLNLELGLRAMDGLERFIKLAKGSSEGKIIKTPKGRVAATIIEDTGIDNSKNYLDAMVTLSGRTREHLIGFPSLDVKIKGGLSFKGFSSFKLYKLSTKSGLYDFVFLSVFRDMGLFVPRQELVKLYVNSEYKGIYILMETFTPELFTNQKMLEGDVVGVDSDRMFFDYPYGATLKNRYFHRLKEPGNKKLGSRFFLSGDILERLDYDHTAKYLSMSALYMMGHGLGVDDLRFYSNPATGTFYPIPRDLNPGVWNSGEPYTPYLTHFAWHVDAPVYTIWPIKSLRSYNYKYDRSRKLFEVDATSTGVTDLHYTLASFLYTPTGLEAVNRYMRFFADNKALKELIKMRLINTLSEARKADSSDELVYSQLNFIQSSGVRFLGDIFGFHRIPEALTFSDGKESYLWNIRTAEKLDPNLSPSFISPMAYKISRDEHRNQLALTFLIEKKVFEILDDAGVRAGKKSYRRTDATLRGVRDVHSMDVLPYVPVYTPSGSGVESVSANVVRHLATIVPDKDKALVLFLVRNATEEVSDFELSFRDSVVNLDPVLSKTFIIHPDPGPNKVTLVQVMNNQFLRGEKLRLLAFEVVLAKDAIFYTLKMPPGTKIFFPLYMYIPPKGLDKPSGVSLKAGLPSSFARRADGFYIEPGSVLNIKQDVVIPIGKSLHIGRGVTMKIAKGCSIKVTGDLTVNGTKDKPVRFLSAGAEPWGGLWVGGDSINDVKVRLSSVIFDNYGSFPKTHVADLSLNGGVTFYNSRVVMKDVTFSNAHSEDALNFISSTVSIDGVVVEDAFSDGIDMDFSNAQIKGLHIKRSKGDGLDLSFSLVSLEDSIFEQSVDKGLSVGEMSRVYISGSSFISNNMGIANKDQSYVEVRDSLFESNEIAFAEFIKKPTFGKPASSRQGNTFTSNKSDYKWLGYYSY